MARRFKVRSVKANQAYRVDELAEAACVSVATVRRWIKDGMACVDSNRPTIIMGFQALDFLAASKAKAKRPSKSNEFYCFRCHANRAAMGAMADYEPTSENGGRLKALCEVCECQCYRAIGASDLHAIRDFLEVAIRDSR